jgi:hypothetical protein
MDTAFNPSRINAAAIMSDEEEEYHEHKDEHFGTRGDDWGGAVQTDRRATDRQTGEWDGAAFAIAGFDSDDDHEVVMTRPRQVCGGRPQMAGGSRRCPGPKPACLGPERLFCHLPFANPKPCVLGTRAPAAARVCCACLRGFAGVCRPPATAPARTAMSEAGMSTCQGCQLGTAVFTAPLTAATPWDTATMGTLVPPLPPGGAPNSHTHFQCTLFLHLPLLQVWSAQELLNASKRTHASVSSVC